MQACRDIHAQLPLSVQTEDIPAISKEAETQADGPHDPLLKSATPVVNEGVQTEENRTVTTENDTQADIRSVPPLQLATHVVHEGVQTEVVASESETGAEISRSGTPLQPPSDIVYEEVQTDVVSSEPEAQGEEGHIQLPPNVDAPQDEGSETPILSSEQLPDDETSDLPRQLPSASEVSEKQACRRVYLLIFIV